MSVKFSKLQKKVIDLALDGNNMFISGAAGVGKSVVIKEIVVKLRERKVKVAVCSTTGISSINIGGITIHRWSGAGHFRNLKDIILKARKDWKVCEVLIIDEISMLDKELFENLNKCAQIIRKNNEVFGGIQLILVGDFFQLHPCFKINGKFCKGSMCFKSNVFDMLDIYANMTEVFRQKDKEFIDILNEIRVGVVTNECVAILNDRVNKNFFNEIEKYKLEEDILPTYLCCSNREADSINFKYLSKLKKRKKTYLAVDLNLNNKMEKKEIIKTNLKDVQAVESLILKKHCQVILISNISNDLCNGSRGIIVDWKTFKKGEFDKLLDEKSENQKLNILSNYYPEKNKITLPKVRFMNGKELFITPVCFSIEDGDNVYCRMQIPLKLGWAITIHKSQGLTLDNVILASKEMSFCGQFYVALSRVKNIDSLQLCEFDTSLVQVDQSVINFMKVKFGDYKMSRLTRVKKKVLKKRKRDYLQNLEKERKKHGNEKQYEIKKNKSFKKNRNDPISFRNNGMENGSRNDPISFRNNRNDPISFRNNRNDPISFKKNRNDPISFRNNRNDPISFKKNRNDPISFRNNRNNPISFRKNGMENDNRSGSISFRNNGMENDNRNGPNSFRKNRNNPISFRKNGMENDNRSGSISFRNNGMENDNRNGPISFRKNRNNPISFRNNRDYPINGMKNDNRNDPISFYRNNRNDPISFNRNNPISFRNNRSDPTSFRNNGMENENRNDPISFNRNNRNDPISLRKNQFKDMTFNNINIKNNLLENINKLYKK